jgi:hypothetical protein
MRTIFTLLLLGVFLTGVFAQRPRSMDPEPAAKTSTSKTTTKPAPKSMKAKYEGGVFGYRNTMEGTLTFDDENNRLLFKDKKPPKEISIPYGAITSAYADTQKKQPAAATVASHIPYGGLAGLIKTKVRYLTLQFEDPDSRVSGITSFKLENKDVIESVLVALAEKTGMTKRGDIYVKKKTDEASKALPR